MSEKSLEPAQHIRADPSPNVAGAAKPSHGSSTSDRVVPVGSRASEDITLYGMVTTLVRGWWIVILVALVAVLLTVGHLKVRKLEYDAVMFVVPAELALGAMDGLVQDLEQFASLAVLAERTTRQEQISAMERYERVIGSLPLAERLRAAEPEVMQVVFRAAWDEETETWRQPPGLLRSAYYEVLRFFGYPGWREPDAESLAAFLDREVTVRQLPASSVRRLTFSHSDPEFAVALLEKINGLADQLLRERASERTAAQITQLEEALAEPRLAPARRAALETLLAKQYQTAALLQADVPYAAEVLEPAMSSPMPISSNPIVLLALAGVIGVVLGIFVVFLRAALRQHSPS